VEVDSADRNQGSQIRQMVSNWEGPYKVNRCVPRNTYILETLEGEELSRALNGKYLNKILPKCLGRC